MRFPPHLLDEIRARLPVSHVVGRRIALKRKGREYVALSPFKPEKTPSFFVNDQKGFYHCFASGEHGDIFTFLMKTDGVSFPEAVERLAQEAGVPLPAPEARDAERQDERQRLYALLEASARFFEDQLNSAEGTEARRYLQKRGAERAAIARFRLGFAPSSRSALREHLTRQGFSASEMATAGMLIAGDDTVAYDRFRRRLMFPITDLKERVIAFGGRALDSGAQAKYLNSPETPLFHKGQVLFNVAAARAPAHAKGRLVAVEGYMDVLALWEAGVAESVAPLGTALTADQIRLMWRVAPEPILCFDGDAAGRRAAYRAVETVLPHLRPGMSVAFAFLPDGLDPDDLVRQQGVAALEAALSRARPLADVLWDREWESGSWTTPERRARLELQIRNLLARIEDGAVRTHYERAMRERLAETWRTAKPGSADRDRPGVLRPTRDRSFNGPRHAGRTTSAYGRRQGEPGDGNRAASTSLRGSGLVAGATGTLPSREALLLRTLLNHPWLIEDHAEEIAAIALTSPALARLRDAILSIQAFDNSLDRAVLRSQLSTTGLDRVVDLVERANTHRGDRFAEPGASREEVQAGWNHAVALHERQVGLGRSREAAERAWHETGSEEAWARICEIQRLSACAHGAVGSDADGGDGV
jgi:DNA primase